MSGQNSTIKPATVDAAHDTEDDNVTSKLQPSAGFLRKLLWIPPWCRWDVENPPPFTLGHNILYACAGGFTTASLYYSHPILNILAAEFKTSQSGAASIPTMAQAGNAAGFIFLLPLADFFPRRTFVLTLVSGQAIFWIGLCVTSNVNVFLALTFLSALFSGSTQIMLPLVAELSPHNKRAFNISIVGAGPTLAILLARILSGVVTNYTSWRNVYWLALGLQISVILLLWLCMPNYPATNRLPLRKIAQSYPKILWSIFTLYPKHPVLVQMSLISFCTFAALTNYWTTLTFLLAGPPYHYDSTIIGLFGLAGLATMVFGPLYGKLVINPLREPLLSTIVGKTIGLIGIVIGTYTGSRQVAGLLIQAFLQDASLMIVQIANRMAISDVQPLQRNRVNTAFILVCYIGQLLGTKAGSEVYEKHGGWVASGSLSVGIIVFSYGLIALRGPHEQGWLGWSGGWGRTSNVKKAEETETDPGGQEATSSKVQDQQGIEMAPLGNGAADSRRRSEFTKVEAGMDSVARVRSRR